MKVITKQKSHILFEILFSLYLVCFAGISASDVIKNQEMTCLGANYGSYHV